jgi:peptidoglycan/xylan/chitin deacetylase (PgdA/CDA1 family)
VRRALKRLAVGLASPFAPLSWRLRRTPSLLVLTYHRVLPPEHADRATEQPGMHVSPATLAMHLRVLKGQFEMVRLGDWVQRAQEGAALPRRACALTFDDGWRDNFDYAFPVLKAAAVPATMYLLSDLVGTTRTFWPNRLARLLGSDPGAEGREGWPDWLRSLLVRLSGPAALTTPLPLVQIDAAISECKTLQTDDVMLDLLDRLESVPVVQNGGAVRDLMNWEEVRSIAGSGLVDFGSHTRRHIRLDLRASDEVMRSEILNSRQELERQLNRPITSFCYPSGAMCPAAVDLVRQSYASAVTTVRGRNLRETDRHLLRRVGMHEDVSNTESAFAARFARAFVT